MAKPEFDLVVIGGGSGGLVVAAGGAALGAKVALVEKRKLGGDCLWHGCVPSKTLIKSARIAHQMRVAQRYAVASHEPQIDLAQVMERVAAVIRAIEPNDSPERFRGLGVNVIFGDGRFTSPETFEVNGRTLKAKNFVLATGSRPGVPPIAGIDAVRFLTTETVFDLREPVPSLLVIGAGPIGCELAQAFARLGSRVTVVDIAPRILPREDADVASVVREQMEAEGVVFQLGATIVKAEGAKNDVRLLLKCGDGSQRDLLATHLLVAAGRKPNVEGLGLEVANVATQGGRLIVNQRLRTTNARIFACGDVAGDYQFTHLANHHAGIVLRQTLFRLFWARPSRHIPWCTFTDPELARIGLSEDEAKARNMKYRAYRFAFSDLDRARTEGETMGFAKVLVDGKGKVLGAAIVGPHAGELIAEYVLALNRGMKLKELAPIVHVYPTLAEINKRVADQMLKDTLTPSAKKWMQRLFRLQGA